MENPLRQCEPGYFRDFDTICQNCVKFCARISEFSKEAQDNCSNICTTTSAPSTLTTTTSSTLSSTTSFILSTTNVTPPTGVHWSIGLLIGIGVLIFIVILIGVMVYIKRSCDPGKPSNTNGNNNDTSISYNAVNQDDDNDNAGDAAGTSFITNGITQIQKPTLPRTQCNNDEMEYKAENPKLTSTKMTQRNELKSPRKTTKPNKNDNCAFRGRIRTTSACSETVLKLPKETKSQDNAVNTECGAGNLMMTQDSESPQETRKLDEISESEAAQITPDNNANIASDDQMRITSACSETECGAGNLMMTQVSESPQETRKLDEISESEAAQITPDNNANIGATDVTPISESSGASDDQMRITSACSETGTGVADTNLPTKTKDESDE